MKSRDEAWQLLCEFTQSEGLRKHGLAVEAAMRAYARKHGEDEETWGIAGLLHDFDYERYPDPQEHAMRGAEILRERGWPGVIVRAVLSHSDHSGVPRESLLEKTLFAVDELTGFITAVALVKPNKSLAEVDPPSVRKKLKDKAFARSVSREDIQKGIQELGVDWDEHVRFVIDAMKERAEELGLAGVRA